MKKLLPLLFLMPNLVMGWTEESIKNWEEDTFQVVRKPLKIKSTTKNYHQKSIRTIVIACQTSL